MRNPAGVQAKADIYNAAKYKVILQLICLPPVFTKLGTTERFLEASTRGERAFLVPHAINYEATEAMKQATTDLVLSGQIAQVGLNRPVYGEPSAIEVRHKRAVKHNLPCILRAIDAARASITEAERACASAKLQYLAKLAGNLKPAIRPIVVKQVESIARELQQTPVIGYRPSDVFGSTVDQLLYEEARDIPIIW